MKKNKVWGDSVDLDEKMERARVRHRERHIVQRLVLAAYNGASRRAPDVSTADFAHAELLVRQILEEEGLL